MRFNCPPWELHGLVESGFYQSIQFRASQLCPAHVDLTAPPTHRQELRRSKLSEIGHLAAGL